MIKPIISIMVGNEFVFPSGILELFHVLLQIPLRLQQNPLRMEVTS
jgi:hypothetical protein